jgi:hypothetical protein
MRWAAVTAAVTSVVIAAAAQSAPTAHAATGAPTLASRNASDPWVMPCVSSTFTGICLYASSDLNEGGQDTYPMSATYAYTLDSSSGLNPGDPANWVDRGAVLTEGAYPWVPNNAKHLWAPGSAYGGDGDMFLYVPDVGSDGVTSHIGVSRSASPWGPFTYLKQITYNNDDIDGYYMSDPSVFQSMGDHPGIGLAGAEPTRLNGPARWLIWANGDYANGGSNCGGISIGLLDDASMSTLITDPNPATSEVQINGVNTLGTCTGKTRPYLEGAEMYFTNVWGFTMGATTQNPNGRPYLLVFAAKPSNRNSVIAYATAEHPRGPFTYEGVLMEASTTSWTNQASIFADGRGPGGSLRLILFFHDDADSSASHNRKVYATCLTFDRSDGKFVQATRPASTPNLNSCSGIRD